MPIIPWEHFNEIDRFFDDRDWIARNWLVPKSFYPAMDLYEKDNNVIAEVNLPDIKPENVDISVKNGVLTVSGFKEESSQKEEKGYWKKEIRRGSFERSVTLPALVNESKIDASYEKGVLKIVMPKSEEKETGKKIKIKIK